MATCSVSVKTRTWRELLCRRMMSPFRGSLAAARGFSAAWIAMAADLPETPNIQPAPREREEVPVQLSGLSIRTLSGIVVCSVAAPRCRRESRNPFVDSMLAGDLYRG